MFKFFFAVLIKKYDSEISIYNVMFNCLVCLITYNLFDESLNSFNF